MLAQNQSCEDFNQSAGNWQRSNIPTGTTNNTVTNATNTITGSSGLPGDAGLRGDDTSGSTILFNQVDYRGDLTQRGECFCYDFLVINNQQGQTSNPAIIFYQGDASTGPRTFGKRAIFVYNQPLDESDGWVRICAPIQPSQNGQLPTSTEGTWVLPSGAPISDFNDVMTNASGIYFSLDLNANPAERYGYDNICFEDCPDEVDEPTDEGSFCCDNENLVFNGNFEYGDQGFGSDYTQNPATLPGEYNVTDDASAFGATITDHSFCDDPSLYSTNDKFLLVNGKTTQPAGTTSDIWTTSLNLDPEKEYRFCANFKNMPQCTFDILPEIEITTNTGFSESAIINVDPNDPCAWQTVSFCFRGDEDMDFKITLKEDGLGDGNDLAIDDIAVSELIDPELAITVQHQGFPQQVTGSLNTIVTSDDVLPYDPEICDEPYYWFVGEVSNYTPGSVPTINTLAPYGWGNNTGYSLFSPASSGPTPWDLTTMYPNYPFQQNTLYIVAFFTPSCCLDCVDEGFTYQLIYNNRSQNIGGLSIGRDSVAWMKSILGTYGQTIGANRVQEPDSIDHTKIQITPNPAQDFVQVRLLENELNTIEIFTLAGQKVKSIQASIGSSSLEIDIASFQAGMYMVQVTTKNNTTFTSRLLVE